MKASEKELNMLGLCQRAGKLVSGDELVEKALKQGKVHVLICASDVSVKTLNRYQKYSQAYQVPLNTHFNKIQLSHAIGKSRSLCGIQDRGMAKKFLSYTTGSEETI